MAADDDRARSLRRLANAWFALCAATFLLIVLGALVRAHGAGLACPDWPLCFGRFVPAFDLRIGFEWTHRVVAGGISLAFAGLALAVRRDPAAWQACRGWVAGAALLLGLQIALGALTVLHLLASWTVTSHLVVGNAFDACLLLTGLRLRRLAAPAGSSVTPPVRGGALVGAALACLALQLVLGGLVSSRYAGLACPEWPTCNGGLWFPSFGGTVGLHLLHRCNGYLLLVLLGFTAWRLRGAGALGRVLALAAALAVAQVVVGVLNVRLGLPVEVTGLHSALAAALVLSLAAAGALAFARADEGLVTSQPRAQERTP
jgi:cytochrome c oxidase assembly protein subunit 15